MNIISNNKDDIQVYLERKIKSAKDLQQSKIEQQKRQEDNNLLSISQQGLQALDNSTQPSSNIRTGKSSSKCISIKRKENTNFRKI